MRPQFPLDAADIFVEWVTTEGGIGVVAFTDEAGLPYIGLYPLNRMGRPNGLPCWFQRSRLMSDVAVGFRNGTPIVVFIDVEVSTRGVSLIVCVPCSKVPYGYHRRMSAKWGSGSPRYGFVVFPANSNWPSLPFPEDIFE
jgi:hypothetical protein